MSPCVSILMTIFNPGPYLRPAVDSLLAQSFGDFELVAIENGSNDGAKEIIRDYAARDRRVRLTDLPENIGRTAALNLALREAHAPLVAVLDADDVSMPARLARQVALLDARPDVVLVGTHTRHIDENGVETGRYVPPVDGAALYDSFAYINPILHSSAMYRRDAALAVGGYPADFAYSQDFALWLVLIERGALAMIGEILTEIRHHEAPSRFGVDPKYLFVRHREKIALFQKAQSLPRLSDSARRLGRANLATLHYLFFRDLLRHGQPAGALREFAAMARISPLYCVDRAWAKLCRRFAPGLAMDPLTNQFDIPSARR